MANGSFPSSGFGPFPDASGLGAAAPSPSGLEAFAAQAREQELSDLNLAARRARQHDPAAWAKARDISGGLPLDVVLRQQPEVERRAMLDAYGAAFENPALRQNFLTNPDDLQYAQPDDLDKLSGINWLGGAVAGAFQEGQEQYRLDDLFALRLEGRATPEQIIESDRLAEVSDPRNYGIRGGGLSNWLASGVVEVSRMLPAIGATLRAGAATGAAGGLTGAGVGTLAGPGGSAVGASAGVSTGLVYGTFMESTRLQMGAAYREFLSFRDENDQPLDPGTAALAAQISGIAGGTLEQVGMTAVLGRVPGIGAFFRGLQTEGMKQALRVPSVRQALGDFAKGYAAVGAVEVSTEVAQEAIQIVVGELAKLSQDSEFAPVTAEEGMDRLGDAAVAAAQAMTLLGGLGPGTRLARDAGAIRQTERVLADLDTQLQEVVQLDMVVVSPEATARAIDALAPGQEVTLNGEQLIRLYQTQGADPYAVDLPNWRERLAEAVATGSEVVLTKGEFLAHLAKDPKDNPLMDLVRASPETYNRQELEIARQRYEDAIAGETQREPAPVSPVAGTAGRDVEAQLTGLGYLPEQARQYGTLYDAFFRTMASRSGLTEQELYAQFRPEFRQGQQPMEAGAPARSTPRRQGELTGMALAENVGASPEPRRPIISLFESADLSTPLHESGHLFLEIMASLADSSPDVARDYEAVRAKYYAPEDGSRPVYMHEAFAKEFEAYLMEGKAPSRELRSAFSKFQEWLGFIYRSIQKLGGKVSPEMREVFDRMLVAEDALAEARRMPENSPLFRDAQEMGLPLEEYLEYNRLIDEDRAQAQNTMRGRVIGQQRRLVSGWTAQIAAQLRVETREKLLALPPYSHAKEFAKPNFKINRAQFIEAYGAEAEALLPRGALRKDGLPPEIISELLGYATPDDMVYDFRQAPPLRDAINESVRAQMYERFGDDLAGSEILAASVSRAMATNSRETVLATELRILNRKAGRTDDSPSAKAQAALIASDWARGKSVKALLREEPRVRAAAARTAAAVEKAMAEANWAEAARLQRKRLVQNAMQMEATKVSRTIEKIRAKAMRYTRKAPTNIAPEVMQQIRELVVRFEFAKRTDKVLSRRQSLREFVRQAEEANEPVLVADWLADYERLNPPRPRKDGKPRALANPAALAEDATKVNYRELSVEELMGLGDALDNLESIGRKRQTVQVEGKKLAHELVVQEALTSMDSRPERSRNMRSYSKEQRGLAQSVARHAATWIKPERILQWLDNWKYGPMQKLFQSIADAANHEAVLMREHAGAIIEIFKTVDAKYLNEEVVIRSLPVGAGKGNVFTRDELFAVALNSGNRQNLERLVVKDKAGGPNKRFSEAQLAEIMANLSIEDMDRVQQVWDQLDRMWPPMEAMLKRLTGVAPPRVLAQPFVHKGKSYRGGYYPLIYDNNNPSTLEQLAEQAEGRGQQLQQKADELFQPLRSVVPSTMSGAAKARAKNVEKTVALSMNVLPGHIEHFLHDLTHREAVRGVWSVLTDPRIRQKIERVESPEHYLQLLEWVRTAAAPERHFSNLSTSDRLIAKVRSNTVIFTLGASWTTVMAQPLGLFQTLVETPPQYVGGALAQFMRGPRDFFEMAKGLSNELDHRWNQQDRDLRDNFGKLELKDTRTRQIQRWSMMGITIFDQFVSGITWMAAYTQHLNDVNASDQAGAIRAADQRVRLTQGSGRAIDQSKLMNDRGAISLFTMFFSSFNAMYNQTVDLKRRTGRAMVDPTSPDKKAALALQWAFMFLFPPVVGALATGDKPDEDEDYALWGLRKTLLYPASFVPGARDLVGYFDEGYRYGLSPIGQLGNAITRTGGQLQNFGQGEPIDAWSLTKGFLSVIGIYKGVPTTAPMKYVEDAFAGTQEGDAERLRIMIGE